MELERDEHSEVKFGVTNEAATMYILFCQEGRLNLEESRFCSYTTEFLFPGKDNTQLGLRVTGSVGVQPSEVSLRVKVLSDCAVKC